MSACHKPVIWLSKQCQVMSVIGSHFSIYKENAILSVSKDCQTTEEYQVT